MENKTDTSNTAPTKTAPAGKPSAAKVDELIRKAREKSNTLAEKSPEAAKKLNEAAEKTRQANQQREEARKLRDQGRAQRKTDREAENAARLTKRENRKAEVQRKRDERAALRAQKASAKKSAPTLVEAAQTALDSVKSLALSELHALHAAIGRLCKDRSVADAGAVSEDEKPEPGDTVTVVAGEYSGKTGVVTKAQRVRCFVKLNDVLTQAGEPKVAYLYLSQVKVTTQAPRAKKTEAPAAEKAAS